MPLSPRLIAGHKAVTELLVGKGVRIKPPDTPVAEFAAVMPTNTVNIACWNTDVVVTRCGESWTEDETTSVRYPVSHEDPDFMTKLGEALLPVVEEYLSRLPVSNA